MTLLGRQIAPADVTLALAGVLGVLAYVGLLPGLHPDRAARYALDAAEAEERARTFLRARGYVPDQLDAEDVEFDGNTDLQHSLQRAMGRGPALRLLADSADVWPAYYWNVGLEGPMPAPGKAAADGGEPGLPDDPEEEGEQQLDVRVLLTQKGEVFGMTLSEYRFARRGVFGGSDREARLLLGHLDRDALAAARATSGGGGPILSSVPDSTLARRLAFALTAPPDSLAPARTDSVAPLGRAEAVRLARFHLANTSEAATLGRGPRTPAVDSVWTPASAGGRTAVVRFTAGRHGQTARTDVEVFATGGLRSLNASFNPETASASDESALQAWLAPVALVVAALIGIGLLVAFFRRLSERMIDVRAGVIDAVVVAGLLVAVQLFGQGRFGDGGGSMARQVVTFATSIGMVFTMVTLFAFPFVTAATAVGRSAFSERMLSMSMVRRLAFRNRYVGAGLLRGIALAGVLLGVTVLGLSAFPRAFLTGGRFWTENVVSLLPFASALMGALGYGLFVLVLGLTAFILRHVGDGRGGGGGRLAAAVAVAGGAGLFALVLFSFGLVGRPAPLGYGMVLNAATGAVVVAALLRYDALTAFIGLFLSLLMSALSEGWLIAASPAQDDVLMGLLFVAALAVTGAVGVRSGKTGRETADYTPSYITELAERERLKRDIEIAEEVQRSFLPRRMPRVEGLDLAALCLPAREVGGDYYDFIELDGGRLGVVIGDVSGKGIEASFYMTLAKGFLQTLAREDRPPAEVLRRLNALFRRNAPAGTFITMIYGVVDPAEGTFRFARAGHNPLAHCHAPPPDAAPPEAPRKNGSARTSGAEATLLRPRGMAIGLAGEAHFDGALEEMTLALPPGDALVLYTDGFPEARSPGGAEFGEERIRARIERHGARPAQQLLQTLADDVHSFVEAAGRHDDMTMLVIKRTAAPPPTDGGRPARTDAGETRSAT